MRLMEYERLRLSIEGRVARVTLSRPDARNRVDGRLLRELDDVAAVVSDAAGINVLCFDAEGADFCLGWDAATRAELLQPGTASFDPFGAIAALPCVTVASIHGAALSAGLELALACDIRIGGADSRFGLPEVSEGILPLAGATQRLPRVAGKAIALSMLLLGDELTSQQAYAAGLISRLAAAGNLEAETEAIVTAIASRGPLAVRYAKEATIRGAEMTLEQGLRFEADLSVILQTTDDRAEGLRAFFEKRPPQFEGR